MINNNYIPPVYIQIRDILIEKIDSGEFKRDNQLPSEREISETYNISRMTARSALTQLVEMGYAYRVKGKGTFARLPKINRDFVNLCGFSQMLKSKGIKPGNKVVKLGIIEANKRIAMLLGTTIGTKIFEIVRIRYGNNIPLALEFSYLPANLFNDLFRYDFEINSLYKVIEEIYGYRLKYAKQWIKITTLNASESKILKVKENTPAFLLESITYDMDDRVVEATRSLNIGERTTFYTELWPNSEIK
jgi:GntR family transcriptional regulator